MNVKTLKHVFLILFTLSIPFYTMLWTPYLIPLPITRQSGIYPIFKLSGAPGLIIFPSDIFFLALLIIFTVEHFYAKKIRTPSQLHLPIVLFVSWSALSVLNSADRIAGMLELLVLAKVCLVFLLVSDYIKGKRELSLVVTLLIIGLFSQSVLGLIQFYNGGFLGLSFLGEEPPEHREARVYEFNGHIYLRSSGTWGCPNAMGTYLSMLLPLSISLMLSKLNKTIRFASFSISVLGLTAIYYTDSRGAMVGAFVALSLVLFLKLWKTNRLCLKYITIIFIVCLLIASIFHNTLYAIYKLRSHGTEVRISLIKIALHMIRDHPIAGVGLNNFSQNMIGYAKLVGLGFYHPVHNILLLITAETGVIGLSIFLWILFETLKLGIKSIKSKDTFYSSIAIGCIAGLTSLMTHGLVDWTFRDMRIQTLFWLLIALIVAVSKLEPTSSR